MQTNDTTPRLNPRQQAWLTEQQQYVNSGLGVHAFCRQQQLNPSTFYDRRARLAKLGLMPMTAPSVHAPRFIDAGPMKLFASAESPSGVDQPTTPEMTAEMNVGISLRIELGAGVVLTLTRA